MEKEFDLYTFSSYHWFFYGSGWLKSYDLLMSTCCAEVYGERPVTDCVSNDLVMQQRQGQMKQNPIKAHVQLQQNTVIINRPILSKNIIVYTGWINPQNNGCIDIKQFNGTQVKWKMKMNYSFTYLI